MNAKMMFAAGPGEDHEHALPGARAPVRIGAERVADVGDTLVDSGECRLGELLLGRRASANAASEARAASWSPETRSLEAATG